MGKPKARNRTAMLPKQAARLMKEKYIKELEQRPEGGDDTVYAPDQVEEMGRWAVNELTAAPRRTDRRRPCVKEKQRPAPERPDADPAAVPNANAAPEDGFHTKERPPGAPKERQAVGRQKRPAEPRTTAPKERTVARMLKERPESRTAPSSGARNPMPPVPHRLPNDPTASSRHSAVSP